MLELDLDSDSGAALLAALWQQYGEPLAQAARLPSRIFALRSPYAPGLMFIGGQIAPSPIPTSVSFQVVFNLAGNGLTMPAALAACVGEGIERVSQVERSGDIVCEVSYEAVAPEVLPVAGPLIEALLQASTHTPSMPVAWARGRSPATAHQFLVPADWCLRRQAKGPLAIPGAALSTGCAAGPTRDAAASRALLELIERDAAALWWIGGRRGRPLPVESIAMTEAMHLLGELRRGLSGRSSWLLDITTDLAIPCVAALSVDERGRSLACGLAARLSFQEASRAAILEMCQMELALALATAKLEQHGERELNEVDRRHLERADRIVAERCALLHPFGSPARVAELVGATSQEELAAIVAALMHRNVETVLVDLTRSEFGIPVICAIAPELQLMPCDRRTARLRRAVAATGGGAHWTTGAALL